MSVYDDLTALVESVLNRAGEPLTQTAVLKALPVGRKPSKKEMQDSLDKLTGDGRIHRWPGATKKFSAVSPHSFAKDAVLQALSSGPLTMPEIKQKIPTSAKSLMTAARLKALVDERAVQKHPKLGTRQPFGVGPPNAADYLCVEIEKVTKQLLRIGFSQAEVVAALRSYDYDAGKGTLEILDAMPRLNSQVSQGALVHVSELRAAVTRQFPDKESFDRAVLELAEQEKVQLQTHAWPGRLSADEKNSLVSNGRGGFFDAIGLRLE